MVAVRYWQGELSLDIPVGYTVDALLRGLDAHVGVPPGTTATVNGVAAESHRVLDDSDDVVLTRPAGQKGVGLVYTPEALAAVFDVSVAVVQSWIERGLPVVASPDGTVRITETEADAFFRRLTRPLEDGDRVADNAPAAVSHPRPLQPATRGSTQPKPEWIAREGELWWCGAVIRKYESQTADKQTAILNAFQAANWETTLPASLTGLEVGGPEEKKSVRAAALRLLGRRIREPNLGLPAGTIRFHAVRGGWISWRPAGADDQESL